MSYAKEFIELDKLVHDRSSFDCGKDDLNVFLQTQASRNRGVNVSKTMVLPGANPLPNEKLPICAFYTITTATISRADLPASLARKLPRYPIPVFLLAQLAVDKEFQGKGLGKVTLIESIKHLSMIHNELPMYAIAVDCLDEEAKAFYAVYGFKELCIHNGKTRMYIPMNTVLQLF